MPEQGEYERAEAQRQLEVLKKQLFMRMLTTEARSRLSNIKCANPEFGAQIEVALIQIMQSGKMPLIDEKTLISLIKQLRERPLRTNIMRR